MAWFKVGSLVDLPRIEAFCVLQCAAAVYEASCSGVAGCRAADTKAVPRAASVACSSTSVAVGRNAGRTRQPMRNSDGLMYGL